MKSRLAVAVLAALCAVGTPTLALAQAATTAAAPTSASSVVNQSATRVLSALEARRAEFKANPAALNAVIKAEFTRSVAEPLEGADLARIEAGFAALESEAADWFALEEVAVADRRTRRVALMRYEDQGHELAIPWDAPEGRAGAFAAAHRGLYGFDLPGVAIEIVTLRVEAAGRLPAPAPMPPQGGDAASAMVGRQRMLLKDGAVEAPVLDRARLGPGATFSGPAIVTQLDATTLVGAGWQASVHPSGALLLTRG